MGLGEGVMYREEKVENPALLAPKECISWYSSARKSGFRAPLFAAVALIVVLLLIGLLGFELRRSYDREMDNASRITQSLARVLEQQLAASIEKIDLMAREAGYQYAEALDGKGLPEERINPMLARLLSRMPGVLSLRLADEHGKYVFDASGSPSAASIADRKYFLAHKNGTSDGLFSEGPLFSRVVNNWTLTFSRGVHDRGGRFRGIVQSSIQSDSLTAAFHGVEMGANGSIALVNEDLILVARMPAAPDSIGKPLPASQLAGLIAANPVEGGFSGSSAVDGVRRIYSYRRVGEHPFYLVVGTSHDAIMAEWRRTATIYGIVALLLLISAVALVRRATRHFSETERIAEEQKQLTGAVFSNSLEGILVTDKDNRIVTANPAFTEITGYPLQEIVGQKPDFLRSSRHDEGFYNDMWSQVQSRGFWRGEIWNRRRSGESFPEILAISTLLDQRGDVSHYISVFTDITERKAMEERFRFLSEHDYLTGLPNRLWLHGHLPTAMAAVDSWCDEKLGILFLDLDRFKNVNDSLGHNVGDLVLRELARRMEALVGTSGVVTRQGGDEFVIVLDRCPGVASIENHARAILAEASHPFHIDQHEISITGSIGIACYPEENADMQTLFKHADLALYDAKRAGRNQFAFYRPEMDEQIHKRVQIEADLRAAIERQEFVLHYQPQIRASNCALVGVEALLRWNHPRRGMLGPGAFLSVAEESMQILPIGEWVLVEACRQAKRWLDEGVALSTVAVNLSALQFQHQDVLELVVETLKATGLPARYLELEITESLMMENTDSVIDVLRSLKALGVSLAIDDFGTGFSSLGYLERFAMDRIKIDRCFVECLHRDSGPNTIARAIINIAHVLNFEVIAEGVETESQYDYLREVGCDYIQGFLFARPMPPEQVTDLYRSGKAAILQPA
ncbi:MAG: domain S-box/diguanylate cyclase protein [Rhodocyclaceae bacterium]|nr:domain S-box/diguanylate cyclase protein [Rhodocyclaceae bacterium]